VTESATAALIELVRLMDSYGLFAAAARTASLPSSASRATPRVASETPRPEREQPSIRCTAGARPDGNGGGSTRGPGADRELPLLDHQPGYTPTSTHGSAGLGKEELVAGALAAILAADATLFAAMALYRDRAIDFSQLARVVCTLALHHALLGAGEQAAGAGEGAVVAGGAEAFVGGEAAGLAEGQVVEGKAVGAVGKAARDRTENVSGRDGGDAKLHTPDAGIDADGGGGGRQQQQPQGTGGRGTCAGDFATARSSSPPGEAVHTAHGDGGGNDGEPAAEDEAGAEDDAVAEEKAGAEEVEEKAAAAADPSLYADAHVTLLAAMQASGLIEGPDARTLVRDWIAGDGRVVGRRYRLGFQRMREAIYLASLSRVCHYLTTACRPILCTRNPITRSSSSLPTLHLVDCRTRLLCTPSPADAPAAARRCPHPRSVGRRDDPAYARPHRRCGAVQPHSAERHAVCPV
jgi:hypothetical protein